MVLRILTKAFNFKCKEGINEQQFVWTVKKQAMFSLTKTCPDQMIQGSSRFAAITNGGVHPVKVQR
jgi:hypothetical protein